MNAVNGVGPDDALDQWDKTASTHIAYPMESPTQAPTTPGPTESPLASVWAVAAGLGVAGVFRRRRA